MLVFLYKMWFQIKFFFDVIKRGVSRVVQFIMVSSLFIFIHDLKVYINAELDGQV